MSTDHQMASTLRTRQVAAGGGQVSPLSSLSLGRPFLPSLGLSIAALLYSAPHFPTIAARGEARRYRHGRRGGHSILSATHGVMPLPYLAFEFDETVLI